MTDSRLIELAFPLKQASLDSVHEKNVRHGHISTLHIWPARRPLAASRAALIAALLPDPGTPEGRQKLCERIGGKVVQRIEKKKMPGGRSVERIREETEGGILHWLGSEPTSGGKRKSDEYRRKARFFREELERFREEIRKAYGGRAPRVLDPFAGGGAIPLEAMRLGCEVTAVDINPVAWFILKCTLEYPQRLAGKTLALPGVLLEDEVFMAAFYKAHPHLVGKTRRTKKQAPGLQSNLFLSDKPDAGTAPEADLAWHFRAWGKWVVDGGRRDLAKYYPTYAEFQPRTPGKPYEKEPLQLVPLRDDGTPAIDTLNAEFSEEYLAAKRNPRWVAKPTVAYLWARTVICKNCRATVPLLKTRWLCKKETKRVLLSMEPNVGKTAVMFGIQDAVPARGGNPAQRREHDRLVGAGTMSRAGAQCPCCKTYMTMDDIRLEGRAGRLGTVMTAVVVDGPNGKEYRLPSRVELDAAETAGREVERFFADLPFGVPSEPISTGSIKKGGVSITRWGVSQWSQVFTNRQLVALGAFVRWTRAAKEELRRHHYPPDWVEAISAYLAIQNDKVADYNSMGCVWHLSGEKIGHTFTRFALPITWDFVELAVINEVGGAYSAQLDWVARYIDHALQATAGAPKPIPQHVSAIQFELGDYDAVVTDPPYYDAIPYSDLMDFFYLWIKRSIYGVSEELDRAFKELLSPKWDHGTRDGELIEDESRFDGDSARAQEAYRDGMARAFAACNRALKPSGRLVMVFANKQPDAWEALVSALIRSGFVVDGSWPIQTEMKTRMRAKSSAALASSLWLVCKKRPETAAPGWDGKVLEEMRLNIVTRLREYWDAGIRGPDFVWAATGPALEAYSKHPVVKKANDAGKTMDVGEFLSHVRRMVVDFVVGRVLTGDDDGADFAAADRMDAPTAYYLLHRHDFGVEEAPSGACILYATACGLSDGDLESKWDILVHTGGASGSEDEEQEDDYEVDTDAEVDLEETPHSGNKVRLKTWVQRNHKTMGYEAPSGQPVPLIDRIHRLMHLWRAGDVLKVDEYLDDHALRRQQLFRRLLQSLIELSGAGSDERTLLESLSNHVQAKGAKPEDRQATLALGKED